MTETEINRKVKAILETCKGATLQEYKEIIRCLDTEIQTKFKL